jgi:DNA-binding transcriptional LysR family regulator
MFPYQFGYEAMKLNDRIGRRLKLHDLHVFMAVVEAGGMGNASRRLNTSQPAISRSIAELEGTFGVRLLDRNRRGVEPTKFGRSLLESAAAAFDDLRRGVRNIEFLNDPTVGDVRIGGNEAQIIGVIARVVSRLRQQYPGIANHITPVDALAQQYGDLRDRKVDLVLARIPQVVDNDIETETLFYDRTYVVTGTQNKWARRRRIELPELVDEPWCLPPVGSLPGTIFVEAFRANGVNRQLKGVTTGSPQLHLNLLATGPFLAILPGSLLRFAKHLHGLKILPVKLSIPPWPVGFMRLKGRALSPVAQLFIANTREVVKPFAKKM